MASSSVSVVRIVQKVSPFGEFVYSEKLTKVQNADVLEKMQKSVLN